MAPYSHLQSILRTVCLCLFGQGETPSALAILNVLLILIYWNDFTDTLPKTNIVPENGWLEDEKSFWEGLFSGSMCYSSFREGISVFKPVQVASLGSRFRIL